MISDRPYRKALGHERALAEIRKGRGRQFAPDAVNAFLVMMADGAESNEKAASEQF